MEAALLCTVKGPRPSSCVCFQDAEQTKFIDRSTDKSKKYFRYQNILLHLLVKYALFFM